MTALKIRNVILIKMFAKVIYFVKSVRAASTSPFTPIPIRLTAAKIAIIQIATPFKITR